MFRIKIDISEVAAKLRQTREVIENDVKEAVENLSVQTHAFIVNQANQIFKEDNFKRQYYLGLGEFGQKAKGESTKNDMIDTTAKNVRWIKIADGIWMVELDEQAEWLENGRQATFMGEDWWLLKPGKAKTAKDGSKYRVIPFKQMDGKKDAPGVKPFFGQMIRNQAKRQKVSLTKIETNPDGTPKLGVIHKLNMTPTGNQQDSPSLFSMPRTEEMAAASGLKPHSGIYKLKGAAVIQRKDKKGKVKKETVVFRVISSKHKAEGRWMYPEVQGANLFPQAEKWAMQQWDKMVQDFERKFNQG